VGVVFISRKTYLRPFIINPHKLHQLYQHFFKSKTSLMGKGDPKTKRGKIIRGSHGKSRPKLEKEKTLQKKQAAKQQ
jgi:ribosomal small subunit protein bTHX